MTQLIVWNSQGAKWDALWDQWVGPSIAAANDDIVGLVVEAGWAPWVVSGDVTINRMYETNDVFSDKYNAAGAAASDFCVGVASRRNSVGLWVPWVANHDALKTNSRCSMGAVFGMYKQRVQGTQAYNVEWFQRPVLRFEIGQGSNTALTILLVHMISGWTAGAQAELNYLTAAMRKMVPEGTAGIVVGDMNINLLMTDVHMPGGWQLVNTGVATHTGSHGDSELDYALLWDPSGQYPNTRATVLAQYKSTTNGSDHSVLGYELR